MNGGVHNDEPSDSLKKVSPATQSNKMYELTSDKLEIIKGEINVAIEMLKTIRYNLEKDKLEMINDKLYWTIFILYKICSKQLFKLTQQEHPQHHMQLKIIKEALNNAINKLELTRQEKELTMINKNLNSTILEFEKIIGNTSLWHYNPNPV